MKFVVGDSGAITWILCLGLLLLFPVLYWHKGVGQAKGLLALILAIMGVVGCALLAWGLYNGFAQHAATAIFWAAVLGFVLLAIWALIPDVQRHK